MRSFAARFDLIPTVPDTKLSLLLTAGSAQAFDWPTGTDIFRITVGTTGDGGPVYFSPSSTAVTLPTTSGLISTAASSGGFLIAPEAEKMYQRPRASTGFALISGSSVPVCIEFWQKGGS